VPPKLLICRDIPAIRTSSLVLENGIISPRESIENTSKTKRLLRRPTKLRQKKKQNQREKENKPYKEKEKQPLTFSVNDCFSFLSINLKLQ
jgi:hypothetical protein